MLKERLSEPGNNEERKLAMKKRMANIECLRVLAMMMVVMLHYLSKGEFLAPLTGELAVNNYIAWFMEAFSIVAVNVYVLISGYFMVDTEFKIGKLVRLYLQVLFYCLLIPAVLISLFVLTKGKIDILSVKDIGIYKLLLYFLPAQMEHYWFITAYVVMYLFSPFLAAGVKKMSRRELKTVLLCLLCFFSFPKSIVPAKLQIDKLGYDGLWFLCVYLVAAYIKLYGIPFFKSTKRALFCFFFSSLFTFGFTMGLREIYVVSGKLGDFVQSAYSYNHIIDLFGAVSLFYVFLNLQTDSKRGIGRLCCTIGPYTLGVYLLHEHVEIRFLWPKWLMADPGENPFFMVLRCFCAVGLVFIVGVLVDFIRSCLFGFVEKLFVKKKVKCES